MKYTFHIVDVFSSRPFAGNQLAVLPDAAGISTQGMQKTLYNIYRGSLRPRAYAWRLYFARRWAKSQNRAETAIF